MVAWFKFKFGNDCRRAHPKICMKFKKFGLVKFNNKNGCTEDCESYHPKACFESMKTKMCKRADCKFFHLSGTKREAVTGLVPNRIPGMVLPNRNEMGGNNSNITCVKQNYSQHYYIYTSVKTTPILQR